MKNITYTFCGKFIPEYQLWVLLRWRHMHYEHSQLVPYFTNQYSFPTRQVLKATELWENQQVQQSDLFKRQTVTFIFQHIFHIYLSIYPNYQQASCECLMKKRCWRLIAVCMTLSRQWAKFLHQTCIAGLVEHLSPYTGLIPVWMALVLTPFSHKKRITVRCSLFLKCL